MPGWERYVERVERGEREIRQHEKTLKVAQWKLTLQHPGTHPDEVRIFEKNRQNANTLWTEEEDRIMYQLA